jgi:hypothetical protein
MGIFSADQGKRRFPRRGFRRLLGVLHNGDYFLVRGVEIGEGGISFRSSASQLQEGALLVITFRDPLGKFQSVRSIVKNLHQKNKDAVFGCSFENLNFEVRRQIRTFVSARSETEQ